MHDTSLGMRLWPLKRKWVIRSVIAGVVLLAYGLCLPRVLFHDPYCTVVEDSVGHLLSAAIAADGQWRFPEAEVVPAKFAAALVTFEDKRFYSHPGVDVLSLGRALRQNLQAGHVVSGGSTLSMQVIRLMRKGKGRTLFEKCLEVILATRLELRYSKEEILALYASHAPFGGNVVGIEAACWRYYGRAPEALSWAEAATLAVLPNAPALIHPGRNRKHLLEKRNFLLDKLYAAGTIDSFTCVLAREEPLPEKPQPLPRLARHLLNRAVKDGFAQQKLRTTLDGALQVQVVQRLADHHERLRGNQIYNAAALVLDVETGQVLAYVGNTDVKGRHHGDAVDVITAPRSTGSVLKPFLYAAMLDEGQLLPTTLLPDVPTMIAGFAPQNFSREYDGAVPANEALIRSLNIPAVRLLRDYRYEKFHSLLTHLGMTTLTYAPDHYGLSLVLGGAEGTLWDIAGMYASMARTLNHYFEHPGKNRYTRSDYFSPSYLPRPASTAADLEASSWISAAAIYQTFDVLKELYRPGEESGWRHFSSARNIAWKTGTSFGFRDGWAVGVTPEYVVGVWVGNADGEGRPGLTGTDAAAPLLFDIFSILPGHAWFQPPYGEMVQVPICRRSGMRVGAACPVQDTAWVVQSGLHSLPCTYHKKIHLSQDGQYRVHSGCELVAHMQTVSWFTLPPVQAYYYRSKNVSYKSLPPYRPDCAPTAASSMDLIYPKSHAKIFIPHELNGTLGSAIFELAHSDPHATVYWHLDGNYLGATERNHTMALQPATGTHTLTVVDHEGQVLVRSFQVVSDR